MAQQVTQFPSEIPHFGVLSQASKGHFCSGRINERTTARETSLYRLKLRLWQVGLFWEQIILPYLAWGTLDNIQSQVEPVWSVRMNYSHIQSATVPPGHTHFNTDLARRYSIFGSVQMMTKCSKVFCCYINCFFLKSPLQMVCCISSKFKLKNKFRLLYTKFLYPETALQKPPNFKQPSFTLHMVS